MLSNSFPNLFLLLWLCAIDRDSFVEHEHTDKITTVATEMNQILSYAYLSSGLPPLPVPSSVTLLSNVNVKTCIKLWWILMWNWISGQGGMWNKACVVRHELNLCVGSLVTVAYRVSDNVSESSWNLSQRWTETVCQAQRIFGVRTEKEPEFMMS